MKINKSFRDNKSIFIIVFFTSLFFQAVNVLSQTYVEMPLGGNSFVTSGTTGSVGNSGWANWNNTRTVFSTHFRVNQTGVLNLYMKYTSDTDGNVIEAKCKGQTFTVTLPRATTASIIKLGTISNCPTGYVQVDIKGVTLKGTVFAKPTDFLINGTASTNVNYVPSSNMYFGRRGPSVHMHYTVPSGKTIEWFYNEVTIPVGMDPIGTYSMANGFSGGYFGMQVNSSTERRILFSVWSPYETDNPALVPESKKVKLVKKGEGVTVGEFGNEGVGGQSYLKYMWKTGNTYKFLNRVRPSANNYSEYTAYFYAPEEGKWRLIAQFLRPEIQTYYKSPHSFLESFSTNNGYIQRKSLYENQWARTIEGQWIELTEGTFTNDATGSRKERMDFKGGLQDGGFFLENCGFFNDYVNPYTKFTRTATNKQPDVDVNALENEGGSGNIQPTVSISSPANNSTVTTNSITVTASASDADGSIKKVEFYLNGSLKSTDTSAPYSVTISPLNTGLNTIMVKAFDDKDASNTSSIAVTYTTSGGGSNNCNGVADWVSSKAYLGGDKVHYNGYIYTAAYWTQNNRPDQNYGAYGKPWKGDRVPCETTPVLTPPTISIVSPANGTTFYTNSLEVSTTANAPSGLITKVEFYLNGTLKTTKTASPYVATLSAMSQGANAIKAIIYDNKGQKAESAITVNYSPQVANIPPSISITSPSNGATISTPSVNVSVNAEDRDGNVEKVEYYLNGVLKQTSTTAPSFTGLSIGALNSGSNTIRAKVYDDKGATAESTVTVNQTASGAADTQPPSKVENIEAVAITKTSIDLMWNPSIDNVGVTHYGVFDGKLNKLIASPKTNSYVHTGLTQDTEYSYYVRAYDAAENNSDKSDIFTTKTDAVVIPNTPPTVSISSPANGAIVNTTNVSVTANASDADGSISKVEFYLNGSLKSTDTSSPYSASVATLTLGSNSIKVKAFDDKSATAESTINVSYNTPATNMPPVIEIVSPIDGAAVPTSSINLSFNASDPDDSINKIEIYLNGVLKTTLSSIIQNMSLGALKAGTNSIMVKVFDTKGATASSRITVNYVAPVGSDCMGVPAWISSKAYVAGEKVKDGDVIYKADYWTQNNRPSQNFGSGKPWSVVSKCDGTLDIDAFGETQICGGVKILVWKADNVYDKPGTKVVYDAKIYECKYWTKGNTPSNSGAWSLVGPCK